jgi:hypothetical protein
MRDAMTQNQRKQEKIQYINQQVQRVDEFLTQRPITRGFRRTPSVPIGNIFQLIKDAFDGKLNQYLQEIINDVSTELVVSRKVTYDPESAKQLELNIVFAADVVDKYSDLIEMIIGEPSLKSANRKIVEKAGSQFDSHKETLEQNKHEHLVRSIIYIADQTNESINTYTQSCQFLCFFCVKPGTIKLLNAIESSLRSLTYRGLTFDETKGGLLFLQLRIRRDKNIEVQTAANKIGEAMEFLGIRSLTQKETDCLTKQFLDRVKDIQAIQDLWEAPLSLTGALQLASQERQTLI